MSGTASVANTFATAVGNIPLSQLDTNFANLVSYLNDPTNRNNYAADSGTANTYAVTLLPPALGYTTGTQISFKTLNANTGASTLNVNGLGAKSIFREGGVALQAGDIPGTSVVMVSFDGVNFQLQTPPPTLAQYPGTSTNDSAATGNVGEFVSATVLLGSAVTMTTGVSINITSITLTAGDWDVSGVLGVSGAASTTLSSVTGSVSTTSGAVDSTPGKFVGLAPRADTLNNNSINHFPIVGSAFRLSGNQQIFLVANISFAVSTCGAYGIIQARRRR